MCLVVNGDGECVSRNMVEEKMRSEYIQKINPQNGGSNVNLVLKDEIWNMLRALDIYRKSKCT